MSDVALSWDEVRAFTEAAAKHLRMWEGIPVPVPDQPLRLYKGHPMESMFAEPEKVDAEPEIKLRNSWWSWRESAWIYVYEDEQGRRKHAVERHAPDRSMERLDYWLMTLGASIAWKHEAEQVARQKLREMITPHAWRCYDLTGAFLEGSKRSRVTYLFRRSRPTVAMVPSKRGDENASMKVLAVLCLHPIGYYEGSWAGAMVPTDDVLAHLLMMRGDERLYWRKANQHEPASPQAGL